MGWINKTPLADYCSIWADIHEIMRVIWHINQFLNKINGLE
ncbi:hypothetical protein VCRA219O19_180068 [Vibrio crassostreae]|nr:hypothetical protein VCRA2117O379_120100 [Vibrio crassostreae]CAK1743822.1 hypothetical protein VCRA2117O380_120100 [Vibrio crassostreae]CAK1744033.1 hypothetical protein VCRA2119O382_120100 [Vibrio crassostreae]CAK2144959.1 hypothetical protein VCRA2119O381_50096 [Vibrio crassostreae]CAK2404181.1 hypothetical protein VCRA2113O360_120076 [Vibrio crassostreae]